MRSLNVEIYNWKWLATEMVKKNITVSAAARKLNVSTSTIYNWLSGIYLQTSAYSASSNSVAAQIGRLLNLETEVVQHHITKYLVDSGKLLLDPNTQDFKTALAVFKQRVTEAELFDFHAINQKPITQDQRKLINSLIAALESVY